MNNKLGLSLTAILLTTAQTLPVQSSTPPEDLQKLQKELEVNMRQQLERRLTINEENTLTASLIQAFNPNRHPNGPRESQTRTNGIISFVYDYELDGKTMATIYVDQIPVVTFVNENPIANATQLSDRLNQLHRNHIDPNAITAHWNDENKTYTVNVGDEVLITLNNNIISADPTNNRAEDTRQVANRLRRLLSGNTVEYLSQIEGQAQAQAQLAPSVVRETRGVASWYGPGFHGRRSANGEIFNQNALTAAHRSLPFGTMVRVTNLNNGRSVIVRINDRGPFIGNRVIDLSARAAQEIGMISSGVAPIRLEILR